jgi:hypothetical protein
MSDTHVMLPVPAVLLKATVLDQVVHCCGLPECVSSKGKHASALIAKCREMRIVTAAAQLRHYFLDSSCGLKTAQHIYDELLVK